MDAPPGVKYVRLTDVEFWADPDGSIHMATNDPEAKDTLHLSFSKGTGSHRQLARILVAKGRTVPGWDPAAG